MRGSVGQSTVEFALVTVALIVVVAGIGALFHLFGDGRAVDHGLQAASHRLVDVPAPFLADIFKF